MNKKIVILLTILGILFCSLVIYIFTVVFFDASENTNGNGVTPNINETPQPLPEVDDPIVPIEIGKSCQNQSLPIEVISVSYQNVLDYPQISNMPLSCKAAEEKINAALEKHIAASYQNYLNLEEEEKLQRKINEEQGRTVPEDQEYIFNFEYTVSFEVKYNENNLISILLFDHTYAGGAHGSTIVEAYNFNTATGERIFLGDVAKNEANLNAIKHYVITELSKREEILSEDLQNVIIDNNRSFYFLVNGISIKFLEAEIAPYAAGMPEVFVPKEVFP